METKVAAHTPTPWHLHDMEAETICRQDGLGIARCENRAFKADENQANAAFIVLAVNCHEELLDFVKNARIELEKHGVLEYDRMYSKEDIENLIAKAEAR